MNYGAFSRLSDDRQSSLCGWVNMHKDDRRTSHKGYYTIAIEEVYKECCIVHVVDRNLVTTHIKAGDTIRFKCVARHGLYPPAIAKMIVEGKLKGKALKELDGVLEESEQKYPVMKWKFVNKNV